MPTVPNDLILVRMDALNFEVRQKSTHICFDVTASSLPQLLLWIEDQEYLQEKKDGFPESQHLFSTKIIGI